MPQSAAKHGLLRCRLNAAVCALNRVSVERSVLRMATSTLFVAFTLLSLCRAANCPLPPGAMPSVLGGEPALRQLAQVGYQRSPAFRTLILELQSRRGFVYLAWSPALAKPLKGGLMDRIRMTPDGVVCLWVGFRPTRPDEHLLPSLAHELQHAIEALSSGTPDGASLEPFFRGIALYRHPNGHETAAALEVQERVGKELRNGYSR